MPVSRSVLSYLAHPDLMDHVDNGTQPLRIDLVRPHGSATAGGGEKPALMLRPPARIRFDVPELAATSRFDLEMCVQRGQYQRRGSVRFRWSQGDRVLLERTLSSSADTPDSERRWHAASLVLEPERELTLELSYEGTAEEPAVGVAELAFHRPLGVRRTLASADAPNVVFIVIDTLRADRLSAYGNSPGVSPHFDALAASGTLFEQAFASAPWTGPATASLLTALAPPAHGVGFGASVLSPALTTMAEILQEAGLTTAGFSCNPVVSRSRNFDQGFEHFFDYRWKESEEIAQDVVDWLGQHHEYRFFLYLHFVDPHGPYDPAPELAERFHSTPPAGYENETQKVTMERFFRGDAFEPGYLASLAAHNMVLYDGEIASVDATLGLVVRTLAQLDLDDRTLYCITSDHGEEFLEHGLMGHVKQLHDESVHVPLIFRGPRVPAAVRVPQVVANLRAAPTILRLANVEAPESWRGPDLMELARERERDTEPVFFSTSLGRYFDPVEAKWSVARPMHGVRAARRLLFWVPAEGRNLPEWLALFDLEKDPQALDNVAAQHPDVARALTEQIEAWLVRDPRPNERIDVEGVADQELLRGLGYVED